MSCLDGGAVDGERDVQCGWDNGASTFLTNWKGNTLQSMEAQG